MGDCGCTSDRYQIDKGKRKVIRFTMIVIREEKPEDIADIQTINESVYGQPNEAKLVDMLRSRNLMKYRRQ